MTLFEPTQQGAHARLATVNPMAYARTRNALGGAATRLDSFYALVDTLWGYQ